MKKITLLFLAFILPLAIYAQSYRYHKVRDLGTSYSQANTNFCNNTLGQEIKLNIYISSTLTVGNIYFIEDIDGVDRYVKVTYSHYKSNQDADEFVNGTNIGAPITFTCVVDSDGDGVPDNQDNCPNDPGPASNNGCPTPPNIKLIEAEITQSGNTWDVFNNQWPLIEMNWSSFGNPKTTFRFTIKNSGGTDYSHGNRQIDVHMSDKAVLGTGPIQLFNFYHASFSPIATNGELNINFDRSFSAAPNPTTGAFALFENKTYYFHFLITVDASAPPQKHYVFPFKVNRLDINNLTFDLSSLPEAPVPDPYVMTIYDFSGQKVVSKEVSGIAEENEILLNLPTTGIYIVESNGETRKVHINSN
ncbi:MAG: thrombospondin type 3 repeat-containing protein [Allomuricauda sp.]